MQAFMNAIKMQVAAMLSQIAKPRIGIVAAVDPARHMVKVLLQPEGVMSGWVPVTAGWSMLELPALGQQVLTVPQEGDADSMHVVGRVFAAGGGDAPYQSPTGIAGPGEFGGNTPTNIVPGKEVLLRNAGGAVIRLLPDGSIYTHGTLMHDGDMTINGNLLVNKNITAVGEITDENGIHGTVGHLRDAYNDHTHTQGNDSHGDGEVPTNTTNLPV